MELTDYWKILRAHWLGIISITLVGALLGLGWALLQPKVYTANASGIVSAGVSSDLGTAMAGENYAKSRVKSYLDLAKSRSVSEAAIKSLGIDADPDALISQIEVTNPLDTATLKVSASAGNPEAARALAEAWVTAVGEKVTELENANAAPAVDGSLPQSIVTFQSMDAAQLPDAPSSPNTRLAIAIGALAGLALALGYALLRNIFDRRIHSIAEVERETELAVVGTIPVHSGFDAENRMITSTGGNDRDKRSHEEYAVAEAMRELRTNLQFMNIDNPPRSIVITSALPGEGKSTITANLANTIAASGRNVVVIDGDLRRPMVAKTFGLLPGVGLTDVLIGNAQLAEVLQPWGTTGKLWVLGAGKIPPNPSELLGSNAMHDVIEELARHAMVLIDAPPLLPVTDAAILTARTDGALVVSRAHKTTYEALKAALNNLQRIKGHALGVILNGVPRKGVKADGYGYRYRTYYGRQQEPQPQPKPQGDGFKDFAELLTQGSAASGGAAGDVATEPGPRRGRRESQP
ncbi:polysaccharide biosynthesis tyrosine autokinase [Leucobacter sp. wl10]|uniref:polysaccharide biosynthesis tyrosine autokinase n=1 Tax=Leucobacter sp. wl10 TaxID=2304677 RepID=UPI0013C2D2E6|nr:polysaccharide biosynthesis tyrosine autokinase [Leucobacter sp. wl10]